MNNILTLGRGPVAAALLAVLLGACAGLGTSRVKSLANCPPSGADVRHRLPVPRPVDPGFTSLSMGSCRSPDGTAELATEP